jgi:hypothetical protein
MPCATPEGKVYTCGNKVCWSVATGLSALIALVGLILILTLNGNCCQWNEDTDAEYLAIGVKSCRDYDKECSEGSASGGSTCFPDGFGSADDTYGFRACKDSSSVYVNYPDSVVCDRKACSKSNYTRADTFITGLIFIAIGLVFSLSFMCGICPMCCFVKDAPAATPSTATIVQAQAVEVALSTNDQSKV